MHTHTKHTLKFYDPPKGLSSELTVNKSLQRNSKTWKIAVWRHSCCPISKH